MRRNRFMIIGSLVIIIGCFTGILLNKLSCPSLTPQEAVEDGYYYLNLGMADTASARFRAALASMPEDVRARLGLALSEQKAGRESSAIEEFISVLKLEPQNSQALKQLGILYSHRSENWPESIKNLSAYLALKPDDREARLHLASVLAWTGERQEAEEHLRLMVNSDSSDKKARLMLARVLAWEGKGREALPLFEEIKGIGGLPKEALRDYALSLWQAGKIDEAANLYESLVRSNPNDESLQREFSQFKAARALTKSS